MSATAPNPHPLNTELAPVQPEQPIVAANRELLAYSSMGNLLSPLYETALRADPRLERVRLVPINPTESDSLGFARAGFGTADKTHEVHFRLDESASEKAKSLLEDHGFTIKLLAHRLGIRTDQVTSGILTSAAFLHELGHTVDMINHEDRPERYLQKADLDFMNLPIAGKTPGYLRSEIGKKFVEAHWEGIQESLKVKTFEELLDKHSKAYRNMRVEKFADIFAVQILRREMAKKKSLRNLVTKALKR